MFAIDFNPNDLIFVEKFLASRQLDFNDFACEAIIRRIEDEIDLAAYYEAKDEYEKNSVTHTLAEVEKEI